MLRIGFDILLSTPSFPLSEGLLPFRADFGSIQDASDRFWDRLLAEVSRSLGGCLIRDPLDSIL